MQYVLQYSQGIFEIKTSGEAEVNGFHDFIEAVVNHEEWKAGRPILVDHTDLNAGPLQTSDLKTIASFCRKFSVALGKSKCAILTPRDLEFGVGRMWQVFVEIDVWEVTQEVFKSEEKALDWLLS